VADKRLDPKSEEFFNKYGFKLSSSKSHPIHQDMMHFDGLEADYVSFLEREMEHYKSAYLREVEMNQRLQMREYYRLNDEIKKLKKDAEES